MDNIVGIIISIIGLFILYIIIKSAIDGSETSKIFKEIKKILFEQSNAYNNQKETKENTGLGMLDMPIDECPACRSKVLEKDKKCQSCGLILETDKE